jgi:hypothetical protein
MAFNEERSNTEMDKVDVMIYPTFVIQYHKTEHLQLEVAVDIATMHNELDSLRICIFRDCREL